MLCKCVMFLLLPLALAFVNPSQPEPSKHLLSSSSVDKHEDFPKPTAAPLNATEEDDNLDEVAGVCIFGKVPSPSCMINCFWRGKSPLCNEEFSCVCRDKEAQNFLDEGHSLIDEDSDTTNTTEPSVSFTFNGPDDEQAGICFFGVVPSISCRLRCYMKAQTALCDDVSNCWCRESDLVINSSLADNITSNVQATDDADDDEGANPGLSLFVIHFLRPMYQSESTSADNPSFLKDDGTSTSTFTQSAWSIPHILAVTIICVFVMLLVTEVVLFCLRRGSSKGHSLKTVLIPPLVEKVYVKE